ncbi:hypothetical protein BSKO_04267 [Bryopsis sp. KO-2023]|nr:hypothetical protein BSKO_04267 [Bryopsis sp. KO-2023]
MAEPMTNVRERALEICRTHGSGSNQYAAFVNEAMARGLPPGVMLPRRVPGDLRDSGAMSARSRKKKGGRKHPSAGGIEKPIRSTSLKSMPSAPSRAEKPAGQHVRSVSETLWIDGLEPVVITTPCSADVESSSGDSEWTSTGTPSRKNGRKSRGMRRTVSTSSTPTSVETEIELKKLRSLADQYNVVVSEKARVESNLSEERKHNESLQRKYSRLERHHSDLTSEQDTMNEQVALQLQHLLKEKALLMEENNKLKAENDGLQVLLEYATVIPESDDDTDLVADKVASQKDAPISLHEISAWHPSLGNPGSGSEGASHFGDENDVQSPTSDGVQVELLSKRLDRITIESCKI